ncbi:SDR family oxidoreductase [Mucilaginibacter pedocola]|uniref:Short-chain dehydrogenase/reductase n=1 Tax=Mucilaginibacter pedocola TaxID=1792845 RepID=A0A1S9PM16_9SPHI|nr:SDR family oxidoreductase [Mucilaginibacter pedocola]OOQ61608.1 short-chain dehydrogenase/reductase [Mucilaginibacter pedocola]
MKNTILITGASSGIGKATAKLFQAKGWNVIATMRTPEKDTELRALDNVLVTKLDVVDLASIANAVAEGIKKFGKIDVLVNNAGYGAYGTLESFSRESIIKQFDTNVIGLLDVTKAVLPHFRGNKSGIIINISSIGGKMTFPLGTLYHGTKFAVEGLSEALSYEVEQFGGKVKIVQPGAIATEFGHSLEFSSDDSQTEYSYIVDKTATAFAPFFENASSPDVVANVIYTAATDGTNQLRYTAGDDAAAIIAQRKQADDETFIGGMKKQFGL